MKELLPIGSIVELDSKKRAMIVGYYPNNINDKEFNDYICTNPTGVTKRLEELVLDKDYFYIKKELITNVLYMGFQDNLFDNYKKMSKMFVKELRKAKLESKEVSEEMIKKIYMNCMSKIMEKKK